MLTLTLTADEARSAFLFAGMARKNALRALRDLLDGDPDPDAYEAAVAVVSEANVRVAYFLDNLPSE